MNTENGKEIQGTGGTQLAVAEMQAVQRPMSLQDGVGLLPVEQQEKALAEYDARRNHFLKWLFSHLKEGIHFGFPPACEATYNDNGDMVNKKTGMPVPASQWIPKPSLYKAGAKLVIDLLRLKPAYSNDLDAWHMMGDPKGTIVRKATLMNPDTGAIIGEGTGAFQVGQKGMDANASIKMADKRADVAAVINGIPVIGELFTQDVEDKLAERRAGTLKARQAALLKTVEDMLIERHSTWSDDAVKWIQKAKVSAFGAGAKLSSIASIDAFEKLLEAGAFDINTAKMKAEAKTA